jgi:hypothetical protein
VIDTHRSRVVAAAAVLLVVVLAGCGTFNAQTDQPYQPARGVNDRSSSVDVLNAAVVSAAEGSGTLAVTLVNNDQDDPDTVASIAVNGTEASIEGVGEIPAAGMLNLAESGAVTVSQEDISAGRFVDVEFTFRNADAVDLSVPVVPNTAEWAAVPVQTPPE